MNCVVVQRHLPTLLDGELGPEESVEIELHLADCRECSEVLAFERASRALIRESVTSAPPAPAPAGLRARVLASLDEVDHSVGATGPEGASAHEPLIRFVPLRGRGRLTAAMAAAAAVAVIVFGGSERPSDAPIQADPVGANALLDDVVRVHSRQLPPDVEADAPQQVVRYFHDKVRFPVRPATFEGASVRLVGARVSNVRERDAAALYYDYRGRRVTVVVFAGPNVEGAGDQRSLDGRVVHFRDVRGYRVPVRHHQGLNYVFTGDVDGDDMLHLAANARVAP